MGTSSAAKPKGIARTRAAITGNRNARDLVQAVLSDAEPRGSIAQTAFSSPGALAALVTTYRFADRVRADGAHRAIAELTSGEHVDQTLPGVLLGLTRVAAQFVPSIAKPSVVEDIAKRALVETVGSALQGSRRGLDISSEQLASNLGTAIAEVGTLGFLSNFLGNYLAGLALFYTGRILAEQLGAPDREGMIPRRQLFERDIRARSRQVGARLAEQLVNQVSPQALRSGDFEQLSSQLARFLPHAISEITEESG